ncbi:MAG: hypothetical protein AAF391_02180 [Bacteroidota bacterium]
MKKSKALYILTLLLLMGIAMADHISTPKEKNQIAVGVPEEDAFSNYQFALFKK